MGRDALRAGTAGSSYVLSVRGVIVLWTPRVELLNLYTVGGEDF